MLRHLAPLLGALAVIGLAAPASSEPPRPTTLGPTQILYMDADTVRILRTLEWHSANVRHQEKLLRNALRLAYWRDHLPPDMRQVFEELGYPTGRVLLTPIGHTEEWWYYDQLAPPLRFQDGALLDRDRFVELLGR
jgi:hypothetical protein